MLLNLILMHIAFKYKLTKKYHNQSVCNTNGSKTLLLNI